MKKYTLALLAVLLCGVTHAQESQIPATSAEKSALPDASEKVELKPHWRAGETFLQTLRIESKTSQTLHDRRMETTQKIGMELLDTIRDVDVQGVITADFTIRAMHFKALSKDGADSTIIEYDSAHPPKGTPPAATVMAVMVGLKFTMKIAPDGHLIDMQGLDVLHDRIIKALKVMVPPGADRAAFEAKYDKQFGKERLREIVSQKMGINNQDVYPDRMVSVGESWTRPMELNDDFLISPTTYTLRDRKDGVSHIDMKANVTLDSSKKPNQTASFKTSTKMAGSQTGTIDIRESDGWLTKMQISQRLSGTVSLTILANAAGKSPTRESWPIYTLNTMTMESADQ